MSQISSSTVVFSSEEINSLSSLVAELRKTASIYQKQAESSKLDETKSYHNALASLAYDKIHTLKAIIDKMLKHNLSLLP